MHHRCGAAAVWYSWSPQCHTRSNNSYTLLITRDLLPKSSPSSDLRRDAVRRPVIELLLSLKPLQLEYASRKVVLKPLFSDDPLHGNDDTKKPILPMTSTESLKISVRAL